MAIRNIVKIDREKCNGCGLCVTACAEGAIRIIDGKAQLVSEIYCDGLGACLGHCPMDAITIEQREADNFDEEAVRKYLDAQKPAAPKASTGFTCPGMQTAHRQVAAISEGDAGSSPSQLAQWPVQLKLVSPQASYFNGADLLLTADCVPFAMGDFHARLLRGRAIAIACPKLDDPQGYVDKIAEMIRLNNLNSLSVIRMQVPCCSGLTRLVTAAIEQSGVAIDINEIIISPEGQILEEKVHPVG